MLDTTTDNLPTDSPLADLGPLAWVFDELRKSLEGANKAIKRFVREAAQMEPDGLDMLDPTPLRSARQQLHQAVGALEMVGLEQPAQLARAMEAAVQRFVQRPQECDETAVQQVEQAGFALLEFLQAVLNNKPLQPLVLFPQYRNVQKLAGADRIHPADLWTFDRLSVNVDAPVVKNELMPSKAMNSLLERLVYVVVKTQSVASTVQLSRMFAGLSAGAKNPRERTFWHVAAAYFDGSAKRKLPLDVYAKRATSRVLLQYKSLWSKPESGEPSGPVSETLLRDLLFFCASAKGADDKQDTPLLAHIRQTYGFAGATLPDYSRASLGRFDPALLAQARKRVHTAKESWSLFTGGDVNRGRQVVDQYGLIGESLVKLDPQAKGLADTLSTAVEFGVRESKISVTPELSMEVATTTLYLEAAFADFDPADATFTSRCGELVARLERVLAGEPGRPLEAWMEQLYRQVSDRQTMGSVVGELKISLAETEKTLDQFFRTPNEKAGLLLATSQLSQMRGVLSVLGLDQAVQTVNRMRATVEEILDAELDLTRDTPRFQRLGNNLSALSFLVDMLNYQPVLAKKLFVFDEEAQELRPLMGRTAAEPAQESQTEEDAVAPPEAVDLDFSDPLDLSVASTESTSADAPIDLPVEDVPVPQAAAASVDEDDDDADLRAIFLEEAREVVVNGNEAVSRLQAHPNDLEQMTTLRRAFHTLKGSSRMVGLTAYGEAAWAMEQLFNAVLAEQSPAGEDLLALSHQSLGAFSRWADSIESQADSLWTAQPFIDSAQSLRDQAPLLPLNVPGAEELKPVAVWAEDESSGEEPLAGITPVEALSPVAESDADSGADAWDGGEFGSTAPAALDQPPEAAASEADLTEDLLEEIDFDRLMMAPPEPGSVPASNEVSAEKGSSEMGELPSMFDGISLDFDELPHLDASDAPNLSEVEEPLPSVFDSADLEPQEPAEELLEDSAPQGANDAAEDSDAAAAEDGSELFNGEEKTETEPEAEPASDDLNGGESAASGEHLDAEVDATDVADVADADLPLEEGIETSEAIDAPEMEAEAEAGAGADPSVEPEAFESEPLAEPASGAEGQTPDETIRVVGPLRIDFKLYNVYLNEADEWSRRLCTLTSEWLLETHEKLPPQAESLAHSLGGSSATVGFQPLSDIARALELALGAVASHQLDGQAATQSQAQLFVDAAEDIRRLLHQFAAGFFKDPLPELLAALQDLLHELPAPQNASEMDVDLGDSDEAAPQMEPSAESESESELGTVNESIEQEQESEPAEPFVSAPNFSATKLEAVPSMLAPLPIPSALHLPVQDIDDDIDAMDAIDVDLFPIFTEEALELLPKLGAATRQWAARPDNSGARAEVLRNLHTLKGSARLAGALRLGEMAHRMETQAERLDLDRMSKDTVAPLLGAYDGIVARFEMLRHMDADAPGGSAQALMDASAVKFVDAVSDVVEESDDESNATSKAAGDEVVASGAPKEEGLVSGVSGLTLPQAPRLAAARVGAAVRVRPELLDRLVNQTGEVITTRSHMDSEVVNLRGSLKDLTGNLERLRQQLRDMELQAETQMQSRLAQARDADQTFDPLEFDRFTRVQEITRMMAESVNDVATVQRNLTRAVEVTEDGLAAMGRQTRELQRDLLRTRMVEFEGISERLYRVVRQASKETGKQVRLDISGGHIEMDRGVLDRMTGAFEHLLRNCVVHGIETPEERLVAGKPVEGHINIQLAQELNDVSVVFQDDGAGLNLNRLREKAKSMGMVPEAAEISDAEAAEFVFTPGLSTASEVSTLAGRGVGMDVVRNDVLALGGRVETTSTEGQGVAFNLVLPLTTAVTQVVMVRAGDFTVGVPSSVVERVRRVPPAEVEEAYAKGTLTVGDEEIPFYWAGALLQVTPKSNQAPGRSLPVVIFRSAAQRVAMHVDEVLGNQEVVVKNLGTQLSRLPGLAGMSMLASGAVALIYNPVALAKVYGPQVRQWLAKQAALRPVVTDETDGPAPLAPNAVPLVLVVDDSITVRRVTQRLLQREGYRVALAADGLQALERLQQERPAVVLSDIEMPRMDGFDLVRNLRNDVRLAKLPVIMITSRIAEKHREHARELGVDHYLGKPYAEDELLSLIAHYAHAVTDAD